MIGNAGEFEKFIRACCMQEHSFSESVSIIYPLFQNSFYMRFALSTKYLPSVDNKAHMKSVIFSCPIWMAVSSFQRILLIRLVEELYKHARLKKKKSWSLRFWW